VITRPGFPPTYETTLPPGEYFGRSGKASWNPQMGPQYSVVRFAAVGFTLGKPKLMMDPSDPSTWQRPYVFTP